MRAMTLAIILNTIVANNTAINRACKYSAACYGLRDADFKGNHEKLGCRWSFMDSSL